MREIKFRAWSKEYKQMEWCYNPVCHGELNILDLSWLGKEYELMQFTGLKDKNGKEAYFEDIYKDRNGSVKGIDSDCSYYEMDLIEADFDGGVVIIGNTFENLELLKGA